MSIFQQIRWMTQQDCQFGETCKTSVVFNCNWPRHICWRYYTACCFCINKNFQFVKEFLKLLHMKERTGADEIFCHLVTLINKFDLHLEKKKKKKFGLFDMGLRLCLVKPKVLQQHYKNERITGNDFLP